MVKWVYKFGAGSAEGDATLKNLLGGKGANLAEMSNLGLPVPPGLTITTEVCTHYYENGERYPDDLEAAVAAEDFAGAMAALAALRAPVDGFFETVTVNAEDAALRVNRLKLLSEIRTTMNQVADFSQIEG